MITFLHDTVYFGILRIISPRFRAHQRYVKIQNAHLDGTMHRIPVRACDYCQAREAGRARVRRLADDIFGDDDTTTGEPRWN